MLRTVGGRVLATVPTLFVASLMVFALEHIMAGGPAAAVLGPSASPGSIAAENKLLGLDHSLPDLYWRFVVGAAHGDFGLSFSTQLPVGTIISQRFSVTLELVGLTLVLAIVGALLVGVLTAANSTRRTGRWAYSLSAVGFAVPDFWLATVGVGVFALSLHWLPATGFTPLSQSLSENIRSLVLPVLTLSVIAGAIMTRQVRAAMDRTLRSPFVQMERAAGIRERTILWNHGLRAALVPLLTFIPIIVAGLLGGSVLVENVMNIPGLGTAIVQAANNRDYPLLQAIVLVMTVVVVGLNLVVDLLAIAVDPRVRSGARNRRLLGGRR